MLMQVQMYKQHLDVCVIATQELGERETLVRDNDDNTVVPYIDIEVNHTERKRKSPTSHHLSARYNIGNGSQVEVEQIVW